jgi:hypothetical protein
MNAKQEFLAEVKGKDVLCVGILYDMPCMNKRKSYLLPIDYSSTFYDGFLDTLDFDYDNRYERRELFGTIWYKDGAWSERAEYDGSEWWSYQACPKIPEALGRKQDMADSWQR